MHSEPHEPINRLLAELSVSKRRDFVSGCRRVRLEYAQTLYEPEDPIGYVYFPTTGFISLLEPMDGRVGLEVGLIGSEGMLGVALLLGARTATQYAIVQGAGIALRMGSSAFLSQCARTPSWRLRLLRYTHVLMCQQAQTAVCTRFHTIDARLARWLLMTRDRAKRNRFYLTHKFIGHILGVRRVGITEAANVLHDRGLIGYSRGVIVINDEAGLERAACVCYERGNAIHERTLGPGTR